MLKNKKIISQIEPGPVDSCTDVMALPGRVLKSTIGSSSLILKHWSTPFLSPIANWKVNEIINILFLKMF